MASEGTVRAKAVKSEDGSYAAFIRSNKGKPQVSVKFNITTGPDTGHNIYWYGSFATDGSTDYSIKSLRAMGLKGDDISEAIVQVLDQEVELVLETDSYDGKVKVKFINDLFGGGRGIDPSKVMSKEEVRTFAATMKARMQASKTMQAKPKTAQTSLPTADDDLGF
jgi:hypothetical protein